VGNPYRFELLSVSLASAEMKEHRSWYARMERAQDGTVLSMTDTERRLRVPIDDNGRLANPWNIPSWMVAHVLENYQVLSTHLGYAPDPEMLDRRSMMRLSAPPEFSLVRVDPKLLPRFVKWLDTSPV
jgi:hypothetical protein